jgi:aerobic-type carbon monoxide dehydrogenase small subunit (CoxS/CutS family)
MIGGGAVVVAGVAAGVAIGVSGGGDDGGVSEAGAVVLRDDPNGRVSLTVNGQSVRVDAAPDTPLLYVLRDNLGLKGPKFGCGLAQCGACAVLQDGRQIRSCVTPVSSVGSRRITTLEGLAASYHGRAQVETGDPAGLHPLQQAWIDEQVPQCGYCQNGMLIQAADLLAATPSPTDEQIVESMNGHLCRCGTYNGIVRAIRRASSVMAS